MFKIKDNDTVIRKKNRKKYLVLIALISSIAAVLLAGYGISTYLRLTPVIVASKELQPFTVIKDSDLKEIKVPFTQSVGMTNDRSKLVGRATRTIIPSDEPIRPSHLAPKGQGSLLAGMISDIKDPAIRAYSIPVDAISSCGGDISAGDIVDIIGAFSVVTNNSSRNANAKETVSKIIAPQVRVLKTLGQGSQLAGLIVAIRPQQAQEIHFALQAGKIGVLLNPYTSDPKASITDTTTMQNFVSKYIEKHNEPVEKNSPPDGPGDELPSNQVEQQVTAPEPGKIETERPGRIR